MECVLGDLEARRACGHVVPPPATPLGHSRSCQDPTPWLPRPHPTDVSSARGLGTGRGRVRVPHPRHLSEGQSNRSSGPRLTTAEGTWWVPSAEGYCPNSEGTVPCGLPVTVGCGGRPRKVRCLVWSAAPVWVQAQWEGQAGSLWACECWVVGQRQVQVWVPHERFCTQGGVTLSSPMRKRWIERIEKKKDYGRTEEVFLLVPLMILCSWLLNGN